MQSKSQFFALLIPFLMAFQSGNATWIRINLAGYQPSGVKVAVWGSKQHVSLNNFQLIDKATGKVVFENNAGKAYGSYGPFQQTYRLDFSAFKKPGTYTVRAGDAVSPEFRITDDV